MWNLLKKVARRLPDSIQYDLKRWHYRRRIRAEQFSPEEPECTRLHEWVGAGDWVIDVGANVGHYARLLSGLVGHSGRVLSFEPVPSTFALLAANVLEFPFRNVSLFNVAVTEKIGQLGMVVPLMDGAENPYMAKITPAVGDVSILGISIDALAIEHPIRFIKIDVEGHEFSALKGMQALLQRDRPTLVVEGADPDVAAMLGTFGYSGVRMPASPNTLFRPE